MKTQKFKFNIKAIALIMVAAVVLAACKKDETEDMTPAPTPMPEEKNIVSGNEINLSVNGQNQIIIGNNIGTDISGTTFIGSEYGIECCDEHNFIGGVTDEESNIITGMGVGIYFKHSASSFFVAGNQIGSNKQGHPFGNSGTGIGSWECNNNYIGPGNNIMNCVSSLSTISLIPKHFSI